MEVKSIRKEDWRGSVYEAGGTMQKKKVGKGDGEAAFRTVVPILCIHLLLLVGHVVIRRARSFYVSANSKFSKP